MTGITSIGASHPSLVQPMRALAGQSLTEPGGTLFVQPLLGSGCSSGIHAYKAAMACVPGQPLIHAVTDLHFHPHGHARLLLPHTVPLAHARLHYNNSSPWALRRHGL